MGLHASLFGDTAKPSRQRHLRRLATCELRQEPRGAPIAASTATAAADFSLRGSSHEEPGVANWHSSSFTHTSPSPFGWDRCAPARFDGAEASKQMEKMLMSVIANLSHLSSRERALGAKKSTHLAGIWRVAATCSTSSPWSDWRLGRAAERAARAACSWADTCRCHRCWEFSTGSRNGGRLGDTARCSDSTRLFGCLLVSAKENASVKIRRSQERSSKGSARYSADLSGDTTNELATREETYPAGTCRGDRQ